MKKSKFVIPAAMLLLAGVYIGMRQAGAGTSSHRLEYAMRCKNFVRRVNRRDYAACLSSMSGELRETMNEDRLRRIFDPILDELGDFRYFRSFSLRHREAQEAVLPACQLKGEYENGSCEFTILFDPDLKISGLHVK